MHHELKEHLESMVEITSVCHQLLQSILSDVNNNFQNIDCTQDKELYTKLDKAIGKLCFMSNDLMPELSYEIKDDDNLKNRYFIIPEMTPINVDSQGRYLEIVNSPYLIE